MSFPKSLIGILTETNELKEAVQKLSLEKAAIDGSQQWSLAEALTEDNSAGFEIIGTLYVAGDQTPGYFVEKCGAKATVFAVSKFYRAQVVDLEKGVIKITDKGRKVAEKIEKTIGCPLRLYWEAKNSQLRDENRRSQGVFYASAQDIYRLFGDCYVGVFCSNEGKVILDHDKNSDVLMQRVRKAHPDKFMSFHFAELNECVGLPYEE